MGLWLTSLKLAKSKDVIEFIYGAHLICLQNELEMEFLGVGYAISASPVHIWIILLRFSRSLIGFMQSLQLRSSYAFHCEKILT